jgi:hypothetical protein
MATQQSPPFKVDRYVVIHVATTCDEHGVYVTKDSAEVIELGWILLDANTLDEVGQAEPLNIPRELSRYSPARGYSFTARAFLSSPSTPPSLPSAVSASPPSSRPRPPRPPIGFLMLHLGCCC